MSESLITVDLADSHIEAIKALAPESFAACRPRRSALARPSVSR